MNRSTQSLLMLAIVSAISPLATAAPWTYRGTLNDGGKPANGRYDLRLSLLNEAGSQAMAQPLTLSNIEVKDGQFSAEVDFGINLENAPVLKLKTEVGQGGSGFVSLGEATRFDAKAALAGVCWDTEGNAGTNPATNFIGTTDAQAFVVRTRNAPSLRIEPSTILFSGLPITTNTIAGSSANSVNADVRGATIAGGGVPSSNSDPLFNTGGANHVTDNYGTVGGGFNNRAGDNSGTTSDKSLATVGGGNGNVASGPGSTVGGGVFHTASGSNSSVSGGERNTASGSRSTVGGGLLNTASGLGSTVSGGEANTASGADSNVSGGIDNCAGADRSWAGGTRAKVRPAFDPATGPCSGLTYPGGTGDEGTFVWADGQNGNFFSTGPNQFAIRASGGLRWGGTGIASSTSPAFTQIVTIGTNTCDGGSGVANSRLILTHPLLNNNPAAVVLFSANFGTLTAGGGAPPRNPLAIYYSDAVNGTCPVGRWIIYQTSVTAETLNNNSRYNIWFVLP